MSKRNEVILSKKMNNCSGGPLRRAICLAALILVCAVHVYAAAKGLGYEADRWALDEDGRPPETQIAIENVTAWPNLVPLSDGTILAFVYNQASHGRKPGDVDCWASIDEGKTWTKRSVAAPRGTPEQNRMNVAAGVTADGHVILVTSGWSDPGNPDAWSNIGHVLPTWVCISKDNGVTWTIDRDSFPKAPDGRHLIPFGDIMPRADGKLRVAAYRGPRGPADGEVPPVPEDDELAARAAKGQNWIVRGDGKNWDPPVPICKRPARNETAIFHLGDGKWLAAARGGLMLMTSDDDGKTWKRRYKSVANGIPADLIRLADGTILLSYGMRVRPRGVGGVEVKFSTDEGETWSDAYRLLDSSPLNTDLGYPSSVQLKDGRVLTAYYEGHQKRSHSFDKGVLKPFSYRMGVVTWDPKKTRKSEPFPTYFVWKGKMHAVSSLFNQKKYEEALTALDALLADAPNAREKADANSMAALCLAHLKKIDQAMKRAEAITIPAVRDHAKMEVMTLAGKNAELIEAFKDADMTGWPEEFAYHGYLLRGNARAGVKDWTSAIQDWEKATELMGFKTELKADTWSRIGSAHENLKAMDQALAAFRRAIEIREKCNLQDPIASASTAVNAAQILIDQEKPKEALEVLNKVDPSGSITWGPRALRMAGALHLELGETKKALAKYQEGKRLATKWKKKDLADSFDRKIVEVGK